MSMIPKKPVIKPFAHQLVSLAHNEHSDIVFDTSDPGTGKTFVRIMAFAKRRAAGSGCALVMCPRSIMRTVWAADIAKFAPHLVVSVAASDNRAEAFAEPADIYVTNHDAAKWLANQKAPFFAKFDELAIDESTAFKHYTSQRSRALAKITKYFKFRTCMTGTPNSNSITDVFHQILLLDDGKRLGKLFMPFRASVASPVQVGPRQNMIKWTDKAGAEDAVFGLLSDIVVRHKLDDCADIPDNNRYAMTYELTATQERAYREVEKTQMLELGGKGSVTAINAAAVATKLLQVASGAVYLSPSNYHVVDRARYELIMDLVEQRKHPLVLFLWKHQRDLLVEEAEKRGLKFAVFDGDTSDKERYDIVRSYQAGAYDVLIGHPKSIGHGHTLTTGTSTIWASPTYDLEIFVQASSRQRRLGQTEKTDTLVIVAKDTLEEKVYDALLSKDARMTSLLQLFASLTPVVPFAAVTTTPAKTPKKRATAETT